MNTLLKQHIKKIILIGCGVHYREKYHSILEKNNVEIFLLIDLISSKDSIGHFFDKQKVRPKISIFLDEQFGKKMEIEALQAQLMSINLSSIEGVLICTEPSIRKPYIHWAISHRWDIFIDKPVLAFSGLDQFQMYQTDFEEILERIENEGIRCVVSCERRAHVGYQWLYNFIQDHLIKNHIPLTGINIHFAGGVKKTPLEYQIDKNHPFYLGYGIALHSGYHYLDLLTQLLELNVPLYGKQTLSIEVKASYPQDILNSLHQPLSQNQVDSSHFGETDLLLIGQASSHNFITTNFNVSLFGSSVSARTNIESTPKLKGRARQEQVVLHFGHTCSIYISSIAYGKFLSEKGEAEDFSITIINSPLLQDLDPIIKLDRKKLSQIQPSLPLNISMNTYGRQWQLEEFLNRRDGNSSITSHHETLLIINHIYNLLNEALASRLSVRPVTLP